MNKKKFHKLIVRALRDTIRVHGTITPKRIGSAAKRIVGFICPKYLKNMYHNETV